MASGCTNGSSASLLFQKLTPDTAVQYTGPAIPALNICTGDTLSEVEAALLQQIIDYSTGVGISIPGINLSTCALFQNEITCCTSCTDLPCLLQAYLTALCTLYSDFTTLQTEVTSLLTGPYNTACLTLGTNPTLTQIIQELITEFCTLVTQVSTLQTTVTDLTSGLSTTIGNFLLSAINTCTGTQNVVKTGTGSTASISFKGFMMVGMIVPYVGPIAGLFDSTGLGIVGTPACGFALANGLNGTIPMQGQVPIGVTQSMGGTIPNNYSSTGGANLSLNQQLGEANHVLNNNEVPPTPISATVSLADVTANINLTWDAVHFGGDGHLLESPDHPSATPAPPIPVNFSGSGTVTGIVAGKGLGHNTIQPSTAVYYVQRLS